MSAPHAVVASLAGVSLRYGQTRAVDDVSLDIPANRMVGLIGPDGVGKSSLLALIAGARKLQDGQVHVLGGDMRDARHRRFDSRMAGSYPSRMRARVRYTPAALQA